MAEDLFAEFPDVTKAQWLEKIARDLGGRPPEELAWQYDEELRIGPYVHHEDVQEPVGSIASFGQWAVGEVFDAGDPNMCNQKIHTALKGGADALMIDTGTDVDWDAVLEGVDLRMIHLGIRPAGDGSSPAVRDFAAFTEHGGYDPGALTVTWHGMDGTLPAEMRSCSSVGDDLPVFSALTDALARALTAPVPPPQIDFCMTCGTAYFVEIARLRALRILWQNVAQAIGFEIAPAFAIEVQTLSPKDDDPYTHMIRSTIAGMAAVMGGANRVYITPATGAASDDAFYRRMARNIHHLLRYESRLWQIPDPLSGAYYLDRITANIIDAVWGRLADRMKGGE